MKKYFAQNYVAAENWADQYRGDTESAAYVVEVFDADTWFLDTEARGFLYATDTDGLNELRDTYPGRVEIQYTADPDEVTA